MPAMGVRLRLILEVNRTRRFVPSTWRASGRRAGYLQRYASPHISRLPLMTNQSAPEIRLLRAAYAAFNARDIGAALTLMTADVTWPKAFKGGFVHGPDAIRAYWTEQWSEIDPHVEPIAFYPQNASQVLVDVHQVVRN